MTMIMILPIVLQCDYFKDILNPDNDREAVEIQVDKLTLSPNDSIKITVVNHGAEPIYLEGCNPIYMSVRADTGWVVKVFRLCVWEGYEVEVPAGSSYSESALIIEKPGFVRFFAPIYRGCEPGKPISQAGCVSMDRYHSPTVQIR